MLLEHLSNLPGVSGNEYSVRNFIRNKLQEAGYNPCTDELGNLFVELNNSNDKPKVMLAAHMDEVGLMVIYIEESGHLRFSPVGGIDPRVLVSQQVKIGRNEVPGVIGAKAIHLQKKEERKKALENNEMFIDLGVNNREEAEKLVKIGDYAHFITKARTAGNNFIIGKALDDRVGCTVLLELLLSKPAYSFPLTVVFTVQEEVGLRGAAGAAYAAAPDIAVVVEGTSASDVEGTKEHLYSTELGKGPALTLMDQSVIANKKVLKFLKNAAENNAIPYQYRKLTMGGTDSGQIAVSKTGTAAATVSVPCRYIHSPAAMASITDIEDTGRLINEFLKLIEKEGGFNK